MSRIPPIPALRAAGYRAAGRYNEKWMRHLFERSARTAPRGPVAAIHGLPRVVICALALATALLGLDAAGAEAVITRLADGQTLSYQPLRSSPRPSILPFDEVFSNVEYNGGPVMPSNTDYAFYWDPPGAPAFPATYVEGLDQYFTDLAEASGSQETVDSVAAQYGDAEGEFASYEAHFGGAILDQEPYPPNGCEEATICLTDEQIQQQLKTWVLAHELPHDLAHEYFVITPPGVEDCFEANGVACSAGANRFHRAYCAYHGDMSLAGEGEIIYANDPFVTDNESCDDGNHPNGPSDGLLEGGLVHEHVESVTDPLPMTGWADFDHPADGGEVADKCRGLGPAGEFGTALGVTPGGARYNQVINGHLYWYQQMWSNQGGECLQRLGFSEARPIATFQSKPSAGGEMEMEFDATGSSAPGGVSHYQWQFDAGSQFSVEAPAESASPTITHTFSTGGTHMVALTVYGENGASGATARTIVVGDPGPTAAFEVAPAQPTPGNPVSFDASASSAGQGSIEGFRWIFGDGSSAGSGEEPSHTYAKPGDYMATVTVTDGAGQTASRSHRVLVKNEQTVLFSSSAPGSAAVGGAPYTIEASASSGLPISLAVAPESAGVCSLAGATVSFTGTGTCTLDLNQAGNEDFYAAPGVTQSFTVGPGAQSISFGSKAPVSAAVGGSYGVEASASSGLPVTLAVAPESALVCSLLGSTVSLTGTGTCTLEANQEGDADYLAAPRETQSFAVGKGTQKVRFGSPAPTSAVVGGSYSVEASASSGLPVSFVIAPESALVCSLNGTTVELTGVGTCTVEARQVGDANYLPAQETLAFAVAAVAVNPPGSTTTTASATATEQPTSVTTTTATSVSTAPPTTHSTARLLTLTLLGSPHVQGAGRQLVWPARVSAAGVLRWQLAFSNADVGFIDRVRLAAVEGELAIARAVAALGSAGAGGVTGTARGCRRGFQRHAGRCVRTRVPLSQGSEVTGEGTVQVVMTLDTKGRRALAQGRLLHVTGSISFEPVHGGPTLRRAVAVVLHTPRPHR